MCPDKRPVSPAVNIVALKDEIVAQDVALTLSDLFPRTESVTVSDLQRLSRMIECRDAIQVAILEMSPAAFLTAPEAASLTSHGARVVLVGPTETGRGAGPFPFRTLEKPFTTEALVAVLTMDG